MQETQKTGVQSLGWEDPLQKEMVTHCSILAWESARAEEPGWESPRGHTESDVAEHTHCYISPKVNPSSGNPKS